MSAFSSDAAVALLLAGHALADFVFQSRAMVSRKEREPRWLLFHALEVLLVQALVFLPGFPCARGLLAAGAVGLAHLAIDCAKINAQRVFGRRLLWFGLDQALHVVSIVFVAHWFERSGCAPAGWVARFGTAPVWTIAFYAFNVHGGSAIVSGVLQRLRPSSQPGDAPGAGQIIGVLERMVMLTLVMLGQWSALGFVLTAKSVARFKELEDKAFAETYLVGTLTSFLVAGASGLLLRALTE